MRATPFLLIAMCCMLAAGSASRADSAGSWILRLRLRTGEPLLERRYENDRIAWKLPERRLEKFRQAGAIIDEEQRIAIVARVSVASVRSGVARLRGVTSIRALDVPRNTLRTFQQPFALALRLNNSPLSGQVMPVESAAMAGLPGTSLRIGGHWTTRFAVTTTLGSGTATFDHRVTSLANNRVEIAVHGRGEITGLEYHLPKLLPGSIELSGAAWYDLASGLVTQESYAIHNRIIKPMEGEESGFDEHLTVDVATTRL